MTRPRIRISRTHFPVTVLGPGMRLGVWVQGCPLACKGCMSLDTWDPLGGNEVEVRELVDRCRDAIGRGATGLTVSGGEPLAQAGPVAAFLESVRRLGRTSGTGYDILMFTGYELDELDDEQRAAAALADVLVTGRYEAGSPTDLAWRGSANQKMVLQTELGRRRYLEHVDERPPNPGMQVRVDAAGAWIVGVPRRGTLVRLDRELRARGLVADRVSWRPHTADE